MTTQEAHSDQVTSEARQNAEIRALLIDLRQKTNDPVIKKIVNAVMDGTLGGLPVRKAVCAALDDGDPNAATLDFALQTLRQKTDDPVVKKFVNAVMDGKLDDPGLRKTVFTALDDGDPSATTLDFALQTLRQKTDDPVIKKFVNAVTTGTLEKPRFRKGVRAALSDTEPDIAALDFALQTLPQSKLKHAVRNMKEDGLDSPRVEMLLRMFYQSSYAADLVATFASALHFEDETFKTAYEAGASISAWGGDIRWRVHTLLHCAAHAAGIEGDFVECGVDRGGTALCAIRALGDEAFTDRRFYLFDTFKGLVREQMTETEVTLNRSTEERFPDVLDEVRERFAPHPFVEIVPGIVPDTLPAFTGEKIAYLHIDLNISYPECAAFEYFWPRLSTGAPVVFDDYAFPSHIEQRKALDDVAAKLGTRIMALPTGQGLLWK